MVMKIDLDAVFLVARAVGRIMIADGTGGSIVNTASMSGTIVNYPQEQVAYNAAKAGVIHLTKSLACEWAKYNIRVNCISPGYVCTDMTPPTTNKAWQDIWYSMCPTKRMASAQEMAGGVLYLASLRQAIRQAQIWRSTADMPATKNNFGERRGNEYGAETGGRR